MHLKVCALAAIFGMISLAGCSGSAAKVTGRVTCQGKPVSGEILISPKGEGAGNIGPAKNAVLDADGRFSVILATTGSHRMTISASDAVPGKVYPCKLSSLERNVVAGGNEIEIELSKREP